MLCFSSIDARRIWPALTVAVPFFIAFLFALPMLIVEAVGWRWVMTFWAVLFAGSALLKLFSLVF